MFKDTWNVTSLVEKEPELLREVVKYRLDIVGLTSTHSLGFGTGLLERDWTFFQVGVVPGERRRAGVGLLIASQFSTNAFEFTKVDERVASLHLRVWEWVLTVFGAYASNSSSVVVTPLFGVLGKVTGELLGTPSSDWETSVLM